MYLIDSHSLFMLHFTSCITCYQSKLLHKYYADYITLNDLFTLINYAPIVINRYMLINSKVERICYIGSKRVIW